MSVVTDETEVARAKRSWPAEYKLRILAEIDRASERGQVGEICRREGLYSSLIDAWRTQRDAGALEGLRDRKTGPKATEVSRVELARLRAKVEALESKLATAEELVAAQGKVSALLHDLSTKSAAVNETKR
jgi:transposase-like protein